MMEGKRVKVRQRDSRGVMIEAKRKREGEREEWREGEREKEAQREIWILSWKKL